MANPIQSIFNSVPSFARNRYFLVAICFFAWMIFMDSHDVFTQWHLQSTKNQLLDDKAYYEEHIEQARADKQDLEINKEKFAREKHYMKKRNEEVFVIVEEE